MFFIIVDDSFDGSQTCVVHQLSQAAAGHEAYVETVQR